MILFHIHDGSAAPPPSRKIDGGWTALAVPIGELGGVVAPTVQHCLFDLDLKALPRALEIKTFLETAPKGVRIFACRRGDHHSTIQAGALGATNLIERPVSEAQVRDLLPLVERRGQAAPPSSILGLMTIDRCFQAVRQETPLELQHVAGTAGILMQDIEEFGIGAWLHSIREHHEGTYRHCLQVAGIATAFGHALGFPNSHLGKLSVAALLHDIGKARISRGILDKPGRLNPTETIEMRKHTVWGSEYLRTATDVAPDIQAAVRGHHEFLDGSGYPDALSGDEIGDLTRLVTIADVFAALTEERAYKATLSAADAMTVLRGMAADGKLEKPLVQAFAEVAREIDDSN